MSNCRQAIYNLAMGLKDYEVWHTKKASLNATRNEVYFYEREVWWVAIGHNIGDEEDGKGHNFARPVLIVRKFNKSLFYGVPLSTALKRGKYYQGVTIKGDARGLTFAYARL